MTLSGVWGTKFGFVWKKWLLGPGYFRSEILLGLSDYYSGVDINFGICGYKVGF